MTFDPISWFLGFILTRAGAASINYLFPDDLKKNLDKTVRDWCNDLPEEIYTSPKGLFDSNIIDSLPPDDEHIAKLVEVIKVGQVPSNEVWLKAIKSIWLKKKELLGKEGNDFFQMDAVKANHYFQALAFDLEKTCIRSAKLFNVAVFRMLEEVLKGNDKILSILGNRTDEGSREEKFLGVPQDLSNSLLKCYSGNSFLLGVALNNSGLILSTGYSNSIDFVESLESSHRFSVQKVILELDHFHLIQIEKRTKGIVPAYSGELNLPDFKDRFYSFGSTGEIIEVSLSAVSMDSLRLEGKTINGACLMDIENWSNPIGGPILNSNNELFGMSFAIVESHNEGKSLVVIPLTTIMNGIFG